MGREIVTLQLGHCANHIGTHFWNTQAAYLENESMSKAAELDHDVLYRTGETAKGEPTYTPRLVICDLKGSLGTLRPESDLYEPAERSKVRTWSGKVQELVSEPLEKNTFLSALDDPENAQPSYAEDLSKSVRVWSDFNAIYYHPNTVLEIPMHTHGDDTNRFLLYTRGREVFDEMAMADVLLDGRIRAFMEESDNPQGFQIFADVFDGFSGISSSVLESLHEEYPKKTRVVFGISPPSNNHSAVPREHRVLQNMNRALMLHNMCESSSLYLPLQVPSRDDFSVIESQWHLNLKPFANMYEWSGYLAAGIETATLPFRTRAASRLDMHDLSALLNPRGGTTVAAMSMTLPLPLPFHKSVPLDSIFRTDAHGRFGLAWDLTLQKPYDSMVREDSSSISVLRGASTLLQSQILDVGTTPYTETQVNEFFTQFLRNNGPLMSHNISFKTPFPVTPSYPTVFADTVTPKGLIRSIPVTMQEGSTSPSHDLVTQFAVLTRLHTGRSLSNMFVEASQSLRVPLRDAWVYTEYNQGSRGLYESEFSDTAESLRLTAEAYMNSEE